MAASRLDWTEELERWLEPFMDALGHSTRCRMCPAYVAGLIGPGDRKSVQPMAARDHGVNYDQLHHFIGSSVWDAAQLEATLLVEANKLVGGEDAWLLIDDTALPKKGRHSVGVAPQCASVLGKTVPDQPPISAELMLAEKKWKKITWRRGTKGGLTCRFVACRVRVADGHKHRMLDNRMQCMPGEEVWLVGERRSTGEQKYYVSNLPADTTIKTLVAAVKARWVCEQAHQQLEEELGLDNFEGRSWTGLHRHALMTISPTPFSNPAASKQRDGKKRIEGPPPQPTMPAIRNAILNLFARPPPRRCPHCEKPLTKTVSKNMPK